MRNGTMIQEKRQVALENLIYLIIWAILFVAPVLGFKYNHDTAIEWSDVFRSWKMLAPFLVLFLFNNYLLMPFLLLRKRTWWYLLAVVVLTGVIFLTGPTPLRYAIQNKREQMRPPDQLQQMRPWQHQPPGAPQQPDRSQPPGAPDPSQQSSPQKLSADSVTEPKPLSSSDMKAGRPGQRDFFPRQRKPWPHDPFFFFMSPLLKFLMMAVLVIGLNIAIKLMFRLMREGNRMKELEKQTLQTELEYLKHQINPHFFMNTLNNIHALIDIDAEKAKETVLDLSKMMRYVLYDTEQSKLPLGKEIQFLRNYIDLMKLRFTDQVDIRIDFPEEIPNVEVPPLLFISFLENAFKHGVSYRHKSYIYCLIQQSGNMLEYRVENSKINDKNISQESGIGLGNVKKRLQLLYRDDYTLEIQDEENTFKIRLLIPV